jgi:hypothetical protein
MVSNELKLEKDEIKKVYESNNNLINKKNVLHLKNIELENDFKMIQ